MPSPLFIPGDPSCNCWSLTYETIPSDLYVRYRNCPTDTVETVLINTLVTTNNGNGTFTTNICVSNSGTYNIPVCVLDNVEVTCDPYEWVIGGICETELDCNVIIETPTPAPTATPNCDNIYCFTIGNCCFWVVQNDGPTANYNYTNCSGNPDSISVIGGTLSSPFCAINPPTDTLFFEPIPQGCCPTATPTSTPTTSPTPTISPTPGPTSTQIPTPTVSPTTTPPPTPTTSPTSGPTSTPSPTPTTSPTSGPTSTPSPTPSLTPTNTENSFVQKNDCQIVTLFPLGIECVVVSQPTGTNTFDGILSVKVTGGTTPYSYYWSGIQGTNIKVGLSPGDYPITVIDYYGDYTGITICNLPGPTPTPTPTQTATPTPTPTSPCQNLCISSVGFFVSYGPWLFICNGEYNNNKITLQYIDEEEEIIYNIVWVPTRNRWEVVGEDMITPITFDSGIMISNSMSYLPTSSWQFYGGLGDIPTINATTESCPETLPLTVTLTTQNVNCLNNNGSIIATAQYGISPYQYSINNSAYGSNSVFNGLSPGTYTIKVKDFENTIVTKIATITNTQTPVVYTVSLVNLGSTLITPGANQSQQTCNFRVNINPPVQIGTIVSFNLNLSYQVDNNSPWTNNDPDQTASYQITSTIIKNGTNITTLTPVPLTSSTVNRPDCSPNETYKEFSGQTISNIQLSSGDNLSGSTTVFLNIFAPQNDENGCQTQLNSKVTITINSIQMSGCSCCSVNPSTSELQYEQYLIGYLY